MVWHARLQLDYRLEAERCVARYEHSGPLRTLKAMKFVTTYWYTRLVDWWVETP